MSAHAETLPHRRADAQRNREAILAAARTVFAEHGLDAPLNEIARRAGVGQGTLYRHFATREDLVISLAEVQLDALADVADRSAGAPDALLRMFGAIAPLHAEQREVAGLIASLGGSRAMSRLRRRFRSIVAGPLRVAQEAGLVRTDLTADDLATMLAMVKAAGVRDPAAGERAVGWMLQAMRAPTG